MSGYRFHAAPSAGEWLNDPNGLMFDGDRYVLFAQHSVAGPSGGDVGWARMTSPDLLHWQWEGAAIPANPRGSAYSGSLVRIGDRTDAFFTRHDPAGPWQTQWRRSLADGQEFPIPGPAGRNCRDPFVYRDRTAGCWRMLVAEPCDWTAWCDNQSTLSVWSSPDLTTWERTGQIGPWHPAGIMWEVPVILQFGNRQVLILSLIDRRDECIDCSVRYWVGTLGDAGWRSCAGFPPAGRPLDHGPDFYAAIVSLEAGWPHDQPVLVGWASNWQEARRRRRSGQVRGGPISLPRLLSLTGNDQLHQAPLPAARELAQAPATFSARFENAGLTIEADRAANTVRINGSPPSQLHWLGAESVCTIFADGDLIEAFIAPEGATLTVFRGELGAAETP